MTAPWFFRDPRFRLAVATAGVIPAFALTLVIVGRYKDQRAQLAREWSDRGERDMTSNPSAAVLDFESALAYGPDDVTARLRLAEALVGSGAAAEAKAHLLTLWTEEPGDGRLNLVLARLSAAEGDVNESVRYYHAAIDGAWEEGAAAARRTARLELARLLLQKGQPVRAQAELIALIGDLPADPALLTDVGRLLIQAGAEQRSIGLFDRALALDPKNAPAARLEGEVAFRAGRYQDAHALLDRARNDGAALDAADDMMLASSARIPLIDPLVAGLTARERVQRALEGLATAQARLGRCQPASLSSADAARVADLSRHAGVLGKLPRGRLERDPDQVTSIITLTAQIEALPGAACGPDTADDRALQLIAAEHRLQTR